MADNHFEAASENGMKLKDETAAVPAAQPEKGRPRLEPRQVRKTAHRTRSRRKSIPTTE